MGLSSYVVTTLLMFAAVGLVPLLVVIAGTALMCCRAELGDLPPSPQPTPPNPVLDYAQVRSSCRGRLVLRPPFGRVVATASGLYLVAIVGAWLTLVWDHRTRTTTVQLLNLHTGRLLTNTTQISVQPYHPLDDGFKASVTNLAPGVVRVSWNQPCRVLSAPTAFHPNNGYAQVDGIDLGDNSPARVTFRV